MVPTLVPKCEMTLFRWIFNDLMRIEFPVLRCRPASMETGHVSAITLDSMDSFSATSNATSCQYLEVCFQDLLSGILGVYKITGG